MNCTCEGPRVEEPVEESIIKIIQETKMLVMETQAILASIHSQILGTCDKAEDLPELRCLRDEAVFTKVNAEQNLRIVRKLEGMLF